MAKDITSAGAPSMAEFDAATGDEITSAMGGATDVKVRDKKHITNDNRDRENIEQYILSQNIDKASRYYQTRKDIFNYQTFRQVNGEGTQLFNKLRGVDNVDVFYNIKTSTLSLMQPKVRIYKVNYEEPVYSEDGSPDAGKTEVLPQACYKEFIFSDNFGRETTATVQDYLKYESTKPNWRNVGLESFSIEQSGEALGILEQNIACVLKLSFKSLKDLNAQPPGEPHYLKGGLRYVDLILWPPSRYTKNAESDNPKYYDIKAIIGYTSPPKHALEGLNISEEEIRAVHGIEKLNTIVSLNLTDHSLEIGAQGQVTLTANYRGRLESTIASTGVNIFQDTMRMGKAGQVKISKTVDPKNNPAHVFKLIGMIREFQKELNEAGCKDDKCASRKKIRQMIENDPVFSSVYEEAGGPATSVQSGQTKIVGDGEEIYLWFKQRDNANRMLAVIRKKVGMFKKDIYKTFVDQLITGNDQRGDEPPETRLFCINVPKEEMTKYLGGVEEKKTEAPSTTAEELRKQGLGYDEALQQSMTGGTTAVAKGRSQTNIDRCNRLIAKDAELQSEVAQDASTLVANQTKSTDKSTGDKKKDPSRTSTFNYDGENYKFYFIYFGDIIELACKNAGFAALNLIDPDSLGDEISERTHPPFPSSTYYGYRHKKGDLNKAGGSGYGLNNMRVLLGPVEYLDAQTGKTKTINLAQFPISFNYFRAWFLKRILRKKQATMTLGNFLMACMNNLIIPAMGSGMPSSITTSHTKASLVSLSLPGKQTGEAPTSICGRMVGKSEEMLPLHRTLNVNDAVFKSQYLDALGSGQSTETMIKTSHDYLLLYVTTSKGLKTRDGNPIVDLKDAIYHFNIGSDRGLLNTMSFERVQLKNMAEMRFMQMQKQGVNALSQLKFPYNTNLVLIGTPLFMPGMYYYVNPSMAGLGDVEDSRSLAFQMNLGGYHVIHKVTSEISPGKYSTTVVGTQVQQGKPK